MVRGKTPHGVRAGYLLAIMGPLVLLLLTDHDRPELRWALVPDEGDVTERADALRLLRALSGGGVLQVQDLTSGELSISTGGVQMSGFEWTRETEWRLFEALATVVEWSGIEIAQPKEVTAEQATQLAQAAHWIGTERIDARLTGPLSFRGDADQVEGIDELRMEQSFGVHLLGRDISLGTGGGRVRLRQVEVGPTGKDGLAPVKAWAKDDRVVFALRPPPGRRQPPLRTQSLAKPPDISAADVQEALKELGAAPAKQDMRSALATIGRQAVKTDEPSATELLHRLRQDRLT